MLRKQIRYSALVAIGLFGVVCEPSHADYVDYHFRLDCNPSANRAEIVPFAVWNKNVYSSAAQDCVFSNGRTVRVKMGLGPVYPYGMGGADPAKWLSVWVDQGKVLSQQSLDCSNEGPCGLRVVITKDGLEVCHVLRTEGMQAGGSESTPKEACSFTLNAQLAIARDHLEYPLPDEKQPPRAGSRVTLYAKDPRFCDRVLRSTRVRPGGHGDISYSILPPKDSELLTPEEMRHYESTGHYERFIVDINNDGKKDNVVALYSRTHYRDGDIYFVFSGDTVPEPVVARSASTHSDQVYAKGAMRILPHYWADYDGTHEKLLAEKDRDSGAYRLRSTSAPWWDQGDEPVFRFRYWYLWPFRDNGVTYFLTASREAAKSQWYTVLRPEPDFRVTEMCVYQAVGDRY